MIKTVITPQNNDVHLSIPSSYVGKQLEILLYTLEEAQEASVSFSPKKMSDFKGIITDEEATQLQAYVQKSREEWNRDI